MNSGEAPNAIEVEAGSEEFERVAQRKGSPQRVRQIFSEFYREHYGEDLPFASTRKYALEWLATRQAESSPATHRRYGDALEKFLSFLGAAADNGLEEISRSQVAAFRDARVQQSATLTANTDLKIIRAVFRSARREGYLFQDPAEGVKTVKNREVFERRPFSIDELRAVLGVADPEWQSLIKFGLYTGQRLGDLARLTWSQIYLERDEIRLTTRKTDKQLLIPIALPLRESTFAGPYAPPAPRLCGRLHILHCAPCGSRE